MKDWLFRLGARIPDAVWDATGAEACLLPYYHMVSDTPVPHVSPLYRFRTIGEFKADVDYFLRRRRAVSLGEFLDTFRQTGGPPRKSFLLTFDDGFREMHDIVAPILKARGVPAVFFLTSATVDNRQLCHHQKISLLLHERDQAGNRFPDAEVLRRLDAAGLPGQDVVTVLKSIPWSLRSVLDELGPLCGVDYEHYARRQQPFLTAGQVRSLLQDGMDIGAHSIDHPRYADIPLAEQLRQTRESMDTLVKQFGLKHRAFAFPHTDHNVSREFFDTVTREGTVEVSFGTSAPARDSAPLNFQRFTMEKTNLTARPIVVRQSLRRRKLQVTGQATIQRPSTDFAHGSPR